MVVAGLLKWVLLLLIGGCRLAGRQTDSIPDGHAILAALFVNTGQLQPLLLHLADHLLQLLDLSFLFKQVGRVDVVLLELAGHLLLGRLDLAG